MHQAKKTEKEEKIIRAAEAVFGQVGFKNAKMEDIAQEAGITKVTLYSYFRSKENLYLAVTYKALLLLIEHYSQSVEATKHKKGIDAVIALLETYMRFCESNYLYSETILEYFALTRAASAGTDQSWLTEAVKQSSYFEKLRQIQNLPFKMTVKEIERGKADGSIVSDLDPMLTTLLGWTMVLGYSKIISASGTNVTPLFNVSLSALKVVNMQLARHLFQTSHL
jgi:AcrR family transcriptional regulator